MKISEDHWLEEANRRPLAGGSAMRTRRFLVMHFTSGATAESSLEFWRSPEAKGASAHLIIDRDGRVYQTRPFNRTCGHAGKSVWRGFVGLNACSIGIEFANAGDGAREDGTAFRSFDLPAGCAKAKHKNGGPLTFWELYPDQQLAAGEAVAMALVARYRLDDLIGHEDIAPTRKNDPGPLFPMARLRVACGFPAEITSGK